MTFESLLSRRYIFAQKRHSLLTISSIAVAVTLMTFLFCAFTTYINCISKGAPYHIRLDSATTELADYVKDYPGVKDSYSEKLSDGSYEIRVFFDKNIVNPFDMIRDIETLQEKEPDRLKLDPDKFSFKDNFVYMAFDMIGDSGKTAMVQYVALFYIVILFLAFALRLIIDTSFEVSAKEREKQFGVLQSIGASPKQIVGIITFEGLLLSAVGIPLGLIFGIGLTFLAFRFIASTELLETYVSDPKYIADMGVSVKPLLILICAVTCLVWVLFSAYGTGMRIIKKSPIQAITERSNTIKKVRKGSLWGLLFGWTGKMATRNNHRQPKRYIITILALTLSITLFTAFSLILSTADNIVRQEFDMIGSDIILESYITNYEEADTINKKIVSSGLFKDCGINTTFSFDSDIINKNDLNRYGIIEYVNRESYNNTLRSLGTVNTISYDELLSGGKYLMLDYTDDIIPEGNSISGKVIKLYEVKEEEYIREHDKKENKGAYIAGRSEKYFKREINEIVLPIADRISVQRSIYEMRGAVFVAPIELYINDTRDIVGDTKYVSFDINYKDYKIHDQAVHWLETEIGARNANYSDEPGSMIFNDFYSERHKINTTIVALKYSLLFVGLLIGAIALVNLVNIISTGIANRKSEIASMLCLGMTPKQLYRMSFIECLQYVFSSAFTSFLLSTGVIFILRKMIQSVYFDADISNSTKLSGMMVKFTDPLPTILIASAVALIAALITSYIPLRNMQKESLVDQIRSVE
ncbi:MAG: ABC transporter permease [Ruminococcus sp.]|nr:ABC transporter permease [Ruminococcus sp.]